MLEQIMNDILDQTPLVHCITNKVTINQCANAILAINGRPIMADDEREVEDMVAMCQALVINTGTLNKQTIPSMLKAGLKANECHHPIVLDPVGIGASRLRYETVKELLNQIDIAVIKGNASELKVLATGEGTTLGVDVNDHDRVNENNLEKFVAFVEKLSCQTHSIIAMTGAIDIVSNGKETYLIRNGCPQMAQVTGTGCMLSAIIGTFIGVCNSIESVAYAVALMGYSGELAWQRVLDEKKGTGSLGIYLIDYLSCMNSNMLKEGIKIEKR